MNVLNVSLLQVATGVFAVLSLFYAVVWGDLSRSMGLATLVFVSLILERVIGVSARLDSLSKRGAIVTADEVRQIIDFEAGLQVGQDVTVRWTCGYYYQAKGKVSKINAKSLRVRLTEDISREGKVVYPFGREIVVPRIMDPRWSINNSAYKE